MNALFDPFDTTPAEPSLHIPDFKKELNPEQFDAVTSPIGPSLVLAGAGSGKTRTLTYRVAFLLSLGIKPWEILLITFTNKAAREMLERVENLTHTPQHLFWGGTFHHIGQKILRSHAESIGLNKNFTIIDSSDSDSLLSEIIKDLNPAYLRSKDNPKPSVLNEIISYSRNTHTSLRDTLLQKYPYFDYLLDDLLSFAKEYQQRKLKSNILDYDDLLVLSLNLLKNNPDILNHYQQKFKSILVDEYQDTNKLQSEFIDLLASNHQIMAVGDDSQSIYSWRGAEIQNILSFPDRHPGTHVYKILTNYRSTPDILNLANTILKNQQHSSPLFSKSLKAVRPHKQKPLVVYASDTRQQALFIIKRIQGLRDEGYQFKDIAILYRAHYQALDLQMELTKVNLPYQITSGVKFFDQAHIKDLVAQLKFLCNPTDTTAFARFTALLPKVGPKTSQKILQTSEEIQLKASSPTSVFDTLSHEKITAKVPEPAKESWLDMAYSLQDAASSISENSPSDTLRILVDGWYADFLRTIYPNWSARKDDLDSFVSFASKFNSLPDLLTQLTLLSAEITDNPNNPTSQDSVRLTTIHQSKGLEFPIVFIIGLSENLFPLKRAIEEDNLPEERRLFYVATTRAKDQLYLSYPKFSNQGGPPILLHPSRFIKELDPSTFEPLQLPPHFGMGYQQRF